MTRAHLVQLGHIPRVGGGNGKPGGEVAEVARVVVVRIDDQTHELLLMKRVTSSPCSASRTRTCHK
jgi:hypothetical protein